MTFLRIFLLFALTLLTGVTDSAVASEHASLNTKNKHAHSKQRVLFIGNSYTYFNNLPQMFAGLAASAKPPLVVEAEMVVVGGATLKSLWEGGKALETLRSGKWDYVVLQEQSTLGPTPMVNGVVQISDPKTFHEYARRFDAEIKKAGAKTIFYLTWARQNAPQTQTALTSAYLSVGKELDDLVAPVGIAWESALKSNPQLPLHIEDRSHPNPAGSYLAACVFYATIFGKSPEGLSGHITGTVIDHTGKFSETPGDLVNLSKSDAAFLQKIAWEITQNLASSIGSSKLTANKPAKAN